MKYDVVVAGAGVSGMTSAILLAERGYRVLLLEKREQTAPLLRGFSRRNIHFDTGFHYTGGLGTGEPLDRFFRLLGIRGKLILFPFKPDGFDLYRSPDGFQLSLPSGYRPLRHALCDAFPGEAAAIDEYLHRVESVSAAIPYLGEEPEPAPSLTAVHGPTLAETLRLLTGNERLRSILGMHCLLYGASPEEVPFSHHARVAGSYYRSATGIRGGGLSLATAFQQRLQELSVDVRCSSTLTAIQVPEGRKVSGVRLADGEEIRCTGCIATFDPRSLPDLVPPGVLRPAFAGRLLRLQESISAWILFGSSPEPLPFLEGRNLFLVPSPQSLDRMGAGSVEERPIYISAAYPDSGGSPAGYIGISPARFEAVSAWKSSARGRRPAEYLRLKQETAARMARQIASCCPELGRTEPLEASSPLTLRDFTSSPQGGLYGIKHTVGQYNPLPLTRVEGLYLAGQGVVAPGILGTVLSGFLAAGSIIGHNRLREELRACS